MKPWNETLKVGDFSYVHKLVLSNQISSQETSIQFAELLSLVLKARKFPYHVSISLFLLSHQGSSDVLWVTLCYTPCYTPCYPSCPPADTGDLWLMWNCSWGWGPGSGRVTISLQLQVPAPDTSGDKNSSPGPRLLRCRCHGVLLARHGVTCGTTQLQITAVTEDVSQQ